MKTIIYKCDKCGKQDLEARYFEVDFYFGVTGMWYKMEGGTLNHYKYHWCEHCFLRIEDHLNQVKHEDDAKVNLAIKKQFELFINQVWREVDKVYETRWDCKVRQLEAA